MYINSNKKFCIILLNRKSLEVELKTFIEDKGYAYYVTVSGRLDTNTAPELDKKLDNYDFKSKQIIFDFSNLDYISSAGLRVLLKLLRLPQAHHRAIVLRNVKPEIVKILETTGFDNLIEIEN